MGKGSAEERAQATDHHLPFLSTLQVGSLDIVFIRYNENLVAPAEIGSVCTPHDL